MYATAPLVFYASPDSPPPLVICPQCDHPLVYRETVIGGITPIERWDYFDCPTCGFFEYRARTRNCD
jgi:hypothetical protein